MAPPMQQIRHSQYDRPGKYGMKKQGSFLFHQHSGIPPYVINLQMLLFCSRICLIRSIDDH